MTQPRMAVVIPAHNERAVIERCLAAMTDGALPGELEIVVVCNGCTDDTADLARRACPEATVLEIPVASKVDALNAGDATARSFPRAYVDADVEVGIDALRDVARVLVDGRALCAAPRPRFDVGGRPRSIRAFYDAWQRLPYLAEGMVGSGVYALSADGRARFGAFPAITADDQFVMEHFATSERLALPTASFTVHTPTRLSGLVRMRTRVYRGNRELAQSGLVAPSPRRGPRAALGLARRRPRLAAAVLLYVAVNGVASVLARRPASGAWERDDSARAAAGRSGAPLVGYLVSRYPSVSHTFVLREVLAARRSGLDIQTFSVSRAEAGDLLSEQDRSEAATTWSIRPVSVGRVALTHLRCILLAPGQWSAVLLGAVRSAPPGLRAKVWRLLYFAQAVLLWDECRRRGIRHVHAHLANVAADIARLCADLGRRSEPSSGWGWSFTMHGPTEFFDAERYDLAGKVRDADLVIAISDFARSQLMAITPPEQWAKLAVVHMGVDFDRYGVVAQRREGSSRGRPLRILSVGRLDPVKGQAVLLDACALLRQAGHEVRLTLVGDGPAAGDLRSRAADLRLDNLVMPGAVGQDDLPAYYRDADVFCMASFAEGIPVVLMEAMASGVAVVSTRINGIPELISDDRSGLLVPPGRADLLAAALSRLVDPEKRMALAAEGAAVVRDHFDAEACGRQVASLLAGLQCRPLPAGQA